MRSLDLPDDDGHNSGMKPSSSGGSEGAEHEALRRLKSGYVDAIRNNRVETLAPDFHSDFHGVMATGRAVNGYEPA